MKNKINIAELLKDCPKGMELDCALFNNPVTLEEVTIDFRYPIVIKLKSDELMTLTEHGCYSYVEDAKCVIFPKGKTTWGGFVPPVEFKDGDILATDLGSVFYLNTRLNTDESYGCYVGIGGDGSFHICTPFAYKECCGFATEEETERLFKAIKDNGYMWNPKNKTLDKLTEPKFKVGDTIRNKNSGVQRTITKMYQDCYECDDRYALEFKNQDYWELVPNKFDISTLVPFESRVLVRNDESQYWIPAFWGYKRDDGYTTTFGWCKYCIPYEGNEHLLRTSDDCDEYYKSWK